MQITTPIIPINQSHINVSGNFGLDLKAICVFVSIGFFLDDDTYWKHKKALKSATKYEFNSKHQILKSKQYFNWHYSPRQISLDTVVDEFTALFENIISNQAKGKKIILPLSGGIDSRSQAAALKHINANVSSFSYEFINGYNETKLAQKVAQTCGFDFKAFKIKKGYLWKKLDDLAKINQCYSDFNSPRQMAVYNDLAVMGDIFSLGHWGDVLFDNYKCKVLTHDEQVEFLFEKLVKRGGLELASKLWHLWGIEGNFKSYLKVRISDALNTIKIDDTNARLRAFKSKYWAPRWTSVNLSIFKQIKPISLPYYDNRMCEFICSIPESYLRDRQIQIAYIKKRNPDLAKLTWQDKRPYNLYNFDSPNLIKTMSYKIPNKIKRSLLEIKGESYVQRNWEIQFLGENNKKQLLSVFKNSNLGTLIPEELIKSYVQRFYTKDAHDTAHPINMLLVLAKFNETQNI